MLNLMQTVTVEFIYGHEVMLLNRLMLISDIELLQKNAYFKDIQLYSKIIIHINLMKW